MSLFTSDYKAENGNRNVRCQLARWADDIVKIVGCGWIKLAQDTVLDGTNKRRLWAKSNCG